MVYFEFSACYFLAVRAHWRNIGQFTAAFAAHEESVVRDRRVQDLEVACKRISKQKLLSRKCICLFAFIFEIFIEQQLKQLFVSAFNTVIYFAGVFKIQKELSPQKFVRFTKFSDFLKEFPAFFCIQVYECRKIIRDKRLFLISAFF